MEVKNISIQDIAGVISIIDVCSQRGAFRGEELAGVGRLRESFLAEVREQQPDQAPAVPDAVDVPTAGADDSSEESSN